MTDNKNIDYLIKKHALDVLKESTSKNFKLKICYLRDLVLEYLQIEKVDFDMQPDSFRQKFRKLLLQLQREDENVIIEGLKIYYLHDTEAMLYHYYIIDALWNSDYSQITKNVIISFIEDKFKLSTLLKDRILSPVISSRNLNVVKYKKIFRLLDFISGHNNVKLKMKINTIDFAPYDLFNYENRIYVIGYSFTDSKLKHIEIDDIEDILHSRYTKRMTIDDYIESQKLGNEVFLNQSKQIGYFNGGMVPELYAIKQNKSEEEIKTIVRDSIKKYFENTTSKYLCGSEENFIELVEERTEDYLSHDIDFVLKDNKKKYARNYIYNTYIKQNFTGEIKEIVFSFKAKEKIHDKYRTNDLPMLEIVKNKFPSVKLEKQPGREVIYIAKLKCYVIDFINWVIPYFNNVVIEDIVLRNEIKKRIEQLYNSII